MPLRKFGVGSGTSQEWTGGMHGGGHWGMSSEHKRGFRIFAQKCYIEPNKNTPMPREPAVVCAHGSCQRPCRPIQNCHLDCFIIVDEMLRASCFFSLPTLAHGSPYLSAMAGLKVASRDAVVLSPPLLRDLEVRPVQASDW